MSDIKRIYEIEVAGVQDGLKELENFSKKIGEIDLEWQQLNINLGIAKDSGDAKQIKEITDKIKALKIELENLAKQREALRKEIALDTQADKTEQIQIESNIKSQTELNAIQNDSITQSQVEITSLINQIKALQDSIKNSKQEVTSLLEELSKIGNVKSGEIPPPGADVARLFIDTKAIDKTVSQSDISRQEEINSKIEDFNSKIRTSEVEASKLRAILDEKVLTLNELKKSITGNTEAINTETKSTTQNSEAVTEESDDYITLTNQIKNLQLAREQLKTLDKPIEFNGVIITDQQAAEQIQRLKILQNELKSNEQISKQTISEQNLSLNNQLSLYDQLTLKIRTLENLVKSAQIGGFNSISFQGQILPLEQSISLVQQLKLDQQELNSITDVGVKKQISDYDQLISVRKQLNNLILSANVSNSSTVTFAGESISIQDAITKREQLDRLIDESKQKSLSENEVLQKQNITLQSGLTLIQQQRLELEKIVSTSNINENVAFQNKILSYKEAIAKLSELRVAEESEKAIKEKLIQDINTESTAISNLIQRQESLQIAIVTAKQGQVAPFSGHLPVNFEDETISLLKAFELETQISNTKKQSEQTLINLKNEQSQINLKVQEENEIRKANLVSEEGSLNNLKSQRDELTKQINSRNLTQDTQTPINFQGEVISLNDAIDKRNKLNSLIDETKQKTLSENEILKSQISLNQELIIKRKSLEDITASAIRSGSSSVSFEGSSLSIDQAVKKIQQLRIEENNLIDLFKVEKNVHDINNIALDTSISKTKAEAEVLRTAIRNAPEAATSINFKGQAIDIADAKNQLAVYDSEIQRYIEKEKLRAQAINIVSGSMKQLESEIKLVTTASLQLTPKTAGTGLGLDAQQLNNIKASIGGIIPEITQFSLQEVNAGKAGDFLKTKLFEMNANLRDFKLSISGSNTLVGDYTKGIVDAFKNLGLGNILAKDKAEVDNEVRQIVIKINELRAAWEKAFKTGDLGIGKIEADLRETTQLHSSLIQKSQTLNSAFQSTNSIGSQLSTALTSGFKSLDSTFRNTLITYVGFQQAILGVQRLIQTDKQLSDQQADLQRVLGATSEQSDKVTESLKKLDTRTSLTALQGFAIIAARAGVATDKIAGVTSAINKLQLIAGSELGDIDTATTSIVKLINIFEGAGSVSEQSVLRIGNAIVTLSNEGVASGKFLVNFSERLAGIQGVAHIGEAAVFGLSAAFEETGQTAEIAATSVAQVLNKVSQNVPKFAELAGKPIEVFRKILQENPAEAIIQLSENLVKQGASIDEVGAAFSRMGITGVRVKTTFQDIGANAEFFRKRISDATVALVNQNVILAGSEQKQQTFAATLDKISAAFVKAGDNPTFVNLLDNIGKVALGTIRVLSNIPFQAIIIGIAGVTSAWALYKGQAISAALADAAVNKQSALNGIARLAEKIGIIDLTNAKRIETAQNIIGTEQLRTAIIQRELAAAATKAEAEGLLFDATAARVAAEATAAETIAQEGLNTAFAVSPIGIFLAALALILPLIGAFASKTDDATTAITEQSKKLSTLTDIHTQLSKSIQEQTGKTQSAVKLLVDVINDESLSLETRKRAYDQLIKIAPEFIGTVNFTKDALGDEEVQVLTLISTYDKFIDKIQQVARAKALSSINEKAQSDLALADQAVFIAKQKKLQEDADNAAIESSNKVILARSKNIGSERFIDPVTGRAPVIASIKTGAQDALNKAIQDQLAQQKATNVTTSFVQTEVQNFDKRLKEINDEVAKGVITAEEGVKLRKEVQDKIDAATNVIKEVPEQDKDARIAQLNAQLDQNKIDIENTQRQIGQAGISIVQANELKTKLKDLHDARKVIIQALKDLDALAKTKTSTGRVEVERDNFNEIEAIRAREIAEENNRFVQLQVVRDKTTNLIIGQHKVTIEQETEHVRKLQQINDEADEAKITKLTRTIEETKILISKSSGTIREKYKSDLLREEKDLADAQASIATRAVDINNQIIAIDQKYLDEQVRISKKDLEARISRFKLDFDTIAQSQSSTNTDIANAHKKMDDSVLVETISHYNDMIKLAETFHLSTEKLEDEKDKAISDAIKASLQDDKDLYDAYFKDVEKSLTNNISSINDKLNTLRDKILNSNRPEAVKTNQLNIVENVQNVLNASAKLRTATQEFNKAKNDTNTSITEFVKDVIDINNASPISTIVTKSQAEIQALHDAMTKAHTDLKGALDVLNQGIENYSNTSNSISSAIGNLFGKVFKVTQKDIDAFNQTGDISGIEKKIQLQQLLSQTISETFQFAQQAMESYFNSEKSHIDASLKAAENRIDLETQQQKSRAQSQAEQESLDRQAAARKRAEEQKAFEANKKLQLAQAKINLGIALSNIILSTIASLNPANLVSLGVAGDIAFAIQAALAYATYATSVSSIQAASFTGAYGLWAKRKAENGISINTTNRKKTIKEIIEEERLSKKFAYGSQVKKGGHVKGNTHAQGGEKFIFDGTIYEDELDEIRVIRTKNSPKDQKYKVEGTQSQIASFINVAGGGINFDPGAFGRRLEFGGVVNYTNKFAQGGAVVSLNPPENPSSFLLNSSSDGGIKDLAKMLAETNNRVEAVAGAVIEVSNQTNTRIDKIQVINVATDTTKKSNEVKKVKSIGTIG